MCTGVCECVCVWMSVCVCVCSVWVGGGLWLKGRALILGLKWSLAAAC